MVEISWYVGSGGSVSERSIRSAFENVKSEDTAGKASERKETNFKFRLEPKNSFITLK